MNKESGREIGKFFVDIAKLVIGGAVLSTVLKIEGLSSNNIVIVGSIAAISLGVIGFVVIILNEENKKQ